MSRQGIKNFHILVNQKKGIGQQTKAYIPGSAPDFTSDSIDALINKINSYEYSTQSGVLVDVALSAWDNSSNWGILGDWMSSLFS